VSAATGLAGREIDQHDDIRHFTIKIGGDGRVRIGQGASAMSSKRSVSLIPRSWFGRVDGDAAALKEIDAILIEESAGGPAAASCSVPPWVRTCSRAPHRN